MELSLIAEQLSESGYICFKDIKCCKCGREDYVCREKTNERDIRKKLSKLGLDWHESLTDISRGIIEYREYMYPRLSYSKYIESERPLLDDDYKLITLINYFKDIPSVHTLKFVSMDICRLCLKNKLLKLIKKKHPTVSNEFQLIYEALYNDRLYNNMLDLKYKEISII
tara:strand:- start:185 stop:691 length:507 start_codon:yes stop_codon:yes gene_type:complete